jgi:hypothetical protein
MAKVKAIINKLIYIYFEIEYILLMVVEVVEEQHIG